MKRVVKLLAGGAAGAAVATLVAVGCGGGGGGGGSSTRFEGNVANASAFLVPTAPASRWAWLSPVSVAWAQATGVEVCLQGTSICTTTAEDGSFTLDTGGADLVDPCLTFTGSDFTGTVCIEGTIPSGSVVRIQDIECSTSTGTCSPGDVDVQEPDGDPSQEVSDEDGPSVSEPDGDNNDDQGDDNQGNDDPGDDDSGKDGGGGDDDGPEDD